MIRARDIHLWLADPASPLVHGSLPTLARSLSADERRRWSGLGRPEDRLNFVAARGILRQALSCCEPSVPPAGWRFRRGPGGRPEIAGPGNRGLRFNLSHTGGLVACVVARGGAVGVDVEDATGAGLLEVADAVLAPPERRALAALPPGRRPRRLARYWTLKEAYVKAVGAGLALPFDQVCFEVAGPGVRLRDTPRGDAGEWCFRQWDSGSGHVVAVALPAGDPPARLVRHGAQPTRAAA